MRTLLTACAALIAVSFGPATADAAPFDVGSYLRMSDGPGNTGGGEFIAESEGESFITFCLQRTEYINFSDQFLIEDISTYAETDPAANGGDGVGRDFISQQTAYLYTQFRAGTLPGYLHNQTWANKLQKAIWMFEQELAMDLSNPYVQLASAAVSSGEWSGIGDVRVMNLMLRGQEAQDQLILIPSNEITEVPEPASLVMLGTGLTTLVAAHRRRARRRHA